MSRIIFFVLTLLLPFLASAYDSTAVQSIQGITDKMIELISGDIDEERNWDEYRNLCLPTAQKISIIKSAPSNRQARTMNLEEFVRNVGPAYARDGFEEYSIGTND